MWLCVFVCVCMCKSGYLDHGSHSHRSRKHKKSKNVKKRHGDRSVIAIHCSFISSCIVVDYHPAVD